MKIQEIKQFIAKARHCIKLAKETTQSYDPALATVQQTKVRINPQTMTGAELVISTEQYQKHQKPISHLIEQLEQYLETIARYDIFLDSESVSIDEAKFTEYQKALEQLESFTAKQRVRGGSISKFLSKKFNPSSKPKGATLGSGEVTLESILKPDVKQDDLGIDLDEAMPLQLGTLNDSSYEDDPFANMSEDELEFEEQTSLVMGLIKKFEDLSFTEQSQPAALSSNKSLQYAPREAVGLILSQYSEQKDKGLFDNSELESIKHTHQNKSKKRLSWH